MTNRLVENAQVVPFILPVDLATADVDGDYVSLKHYKHLTAIFIGDPGTAAQDPTIEVLQATAVDGTGSKALTFTDIYRKQAATNLTASTIFEKVTQTASSTYTNGTAGETAQVWIVEIDAAELDVDNGFDCVTFNVDQGGSTAGKLICAIGVLSEPRFAQAIPLGAIAD